MRVYGVGEWCRQTLGYRLDMDHATRSCATGSSREMDRTPAEIAAAMHECFEAVDTVPLLPSIRAPVLLLGGDKSPIASAQQQVFAETLPNGRVETVAGSATASTCCSPSVAPASPRNSGAA